MDDETSALWDETARWREAETLANHEARATLLLPADHPRRVAALAELDRCSRLSQDLVARLPDETEPLPLDTRPARARRALLQTPFVPVSGEKDRDF